MTPNSPEDPQNLIGQVLAMGDEFPGPAGDVLLSWLLDLKDRADPAKAAATLIERHKLPGAPFAKTPRGELIRLLHETVRYTPEQLSELGKRRRGGAMGRRSGR